MTSPRAAHTALPDEVALVVTFARNMAAAPMAALHSATHAGALAKQAGLSTDTPNPFDRDGEADLARQFAEGLEKGREAALPKARITPFRPHNGTTHAAHTAPQD